jgi:hypothetical protein
MFVVNEDLSIYATRGDTVFFNVTAHDHGYPYKFQPGDIVRFAVYGRKDAETCVLQKDFPVEEVTESVFIYLEEQDTKIGDPISKHKDYWYEVVLNPDTIPQTLIGYDEDGAKIFRLFPESEEIHDEPVVEPEDIPVVDSELDMTSHRPIENQAVARAVATILDVCERTNAAVADLHVTPEMFGAIGDGKADDTEAIQAAMSSGVVNLTKGKSYIVNGAVDIPADTKIDGNYANVLCGDGTVFNVIGDNVVMERLRFVGNGTNLYGINVSTRVKNTRISNVYGEGLSYSLIMNDGENTLISGAYAYNCGWDCVSNYKNAKNATIRDCTAVRCGRHGFSTDEGSNGIKFINCYAEDIGWIDGEGHTCFHLEGACNSKVINCRAVYTENHPSVTESFSGILNGCRIEAAETAMLDNTIEGLDIIYKDGFAPLGNQVFALYFHSSATNVPTVHARNVYIKNLADIQTSIYHGRTYVHLDGFDITGNVYWKQQNVSGYLLSLKNGNIYQGAKVQEFYYAQYGNRGMLCQNVITKNSKALINGRLVDCVIENCVFEDCDYSVSFVQNVGNSGEKSTGNIFRNNVLKDLDVGVKLGWWTGTGNNLIVDNVLKGTINTLLSGSYCGCVFDGNIDGGLTYTTATHNVTPVTNRPLVSIP